MLKTIQGLYLNHYGINAYFVQIWIQGTLFMRIWEAQAPNQEILKHINKFAYEEVCDFRIIDDGLLRFWDWIWVLNDPDLILDVLKEAHVSKLSIHPENTKIYRDLKRRYWWLGMKKNIVDYVSRYLTCQRIKTQY